MKCKETNNIISNYEFFFRSSVKHYYLQNPMPGYDVLKPEVLNDLGNLCLISHSKKSRLSNFMPGAQKECSYNIAIDSIKQYRMMTEEGWGADRILEHGFAMKTELTNSLHYMGLFWEDEDDA